VAPPGPDALPFYNDRGAIELRGVVDSFPEPGDRATAFRLAVKELKQDGVPSIDSGQRLSSSKDGGWTKVEGTALVHAPKAQPWEGRDFPYYRYGDLLQLRGRLETPPSGEDFDYREYLAREGVSSLVRYPSRVELLAEGQGFKPLEAIYHLRGALSQALASALPEPQGSLAQGILLGLRGDIPQSVKEALARTGTAHILAISGQNLTIVLGLVVASTVWLWGRGRPHYLVASLAVLWGYTALTGMSPSVLRAAIMGTLWLLAQYLGRPQSAAPALLFAAALMAGIQPSVLWDISFQLSFAAMAGIIFIPPTFRGASPSPGQAGGGHSPTALLWDALWISGAAVLATAPIIALNFHRFSLTSLPATLLALPALPPIILTSALAAGLGLLSAPLAQAAGWLVWLFTTYLLKVVELFSALPLVSVEMNGVTEPMVWAYYILVAGALWITGQGQRLLPFLREAAVSAREGMARLKTTWLLGLPALAALIIWLAALSLPDGRLHVYFLDVGQGSATFVRTPSGQNVLIDGGPGSRAIDLGLGRALPFWDRGIDLAVLTHPHDDHVTGLAEVLRRYRVGQVLEGEQAADTPNYQEWRKLLKEKGITRTVAHAGQEVRLGQEVKLEVLHPPVDPLLGTASDADNNALVLRLSYGQVSFLLAADLQSEGESY
ncbi:MAG: ComEC/Rec2 family competence protein, partial [Chloroflexota bacterium]|nr:ComEC/Rec2 family competence protein [Chloroflexota bacterium]